MTWVRLDDQFPDHPKLQRVSDPAGWMFVCGLCYCARQRTDGEIPAAKVTTLTRASRPGKLVDELVTAGLWHESPAGFVVHDYLRYQPSAAQLADRRGRETVRKRSQRKSRTVSQVGQAKDIEQTGTGPLTGAGLGDGTSLGQPSQQPAEIDAISESTAILGAVWEHVDEIGVENVAAAYPDENLVAGARLAATWGTDANWSQGPAASLRTAMKTLHREQSAGRSKAEREQAGIDAIRKLREQAA